MLPEKRDDRFHQVLPARYFIAITVLMVLPHIFLEVDIAASEEIFQIIENTFISFYELKIKLGFGSRPSSDSLRSFRIFDIDGKTSFTVYQSHDVIRTNHICY